MQSINVAVINPWFLTVFVSTAAACILGAIVAVLRWHGFETACLLAGSAFYVVGTFLVTIMFNVPRNNALAAIASDDPQSADVWAKYLAEWTAWNHVRTIAALGAMVALIIALRH